MNTPYFGEIAGIITALFWTITALAFEFATKKVGTYSVNLLRLTLAFFLVGTLTWFTRGSFLPIDATADAWKWLSVSGLIGFVLGDLFLFASYRLIGSRTAMLIMTLAPPATAILSYFVLDEAMEKMAILGMTLVVGGIVMTILGKPNGSKKIRLSFSPRGLFYALLGALGQAGGLVLSKLGMGDYNPFAATQIRIIAGIFGFVLLITILGKWGSIRRSLGQPKALTTIGIGSFFGPFLGVSFSLIAVQHTHAGIAATLMAIVPIIIIAPSHYLFKERVTYKEIAGAVISVAGVALFFI